MRCTESRQAGASRRSVARLRARHVGAWLGLAALAACHTAPPPEARNANAAPPRATPAAPAQPTRRPAQTYNEYMALIATRLVAANPTITYLTPSPNPVPAILCLEIEVNADGSLRNIEVARKPAFADMQDTIPIAIAAVRRAAPFGDPTHLARPWKFREYFLFDENRHFKPRELD